MRKYKRRTFLLAGALILLLVFSNQLLFYTVSGWWEGKLENEKELPECDGLILLGGFSSFQDKTERIVFNGSADRLLQALDIYKHGKIRYFIFTGGSALILQKERTEGDFLYDYLRNSGVSEEDLLIESNSRNTHENALFTLAILKEKNLLEKHFALVTSAFHMKRAMGCFLKEGIHVVPYKTNPLQALRKPDFADCITPSAGVLSGWEQLFREWVGIIVYKIKGYI